MQRDQALTIALNGATGRMGTMQHLRALTAIRAEGGLPLRDGSRIMPVPTLVGRNADKLKRLAMANGDLAWTADLDAAIGDEAIDIFFDCSSATDRPAMARNALATGKHIYLEKPTADTLDDALELARLAEQSGRKHGVVQDKLHLPGFVKLRSVIESGLLGRITSVRLDFGWWIFDGGLHPSQRMSWNYRKAEGGGLVHDMYPHWRYIVERLFGEIASVSCTVQTAIPERVDEKGDRYVVDVEDEAFSILRLDNDVLVRIDSSWATRPRRDDMLVVQADGIDGSAVCSLHQCWIQPLATTPKPLWNVDARQATDLPGCWQEVPDVHSYVTPFRACWEGFLRHVAEDASWPSPLIEGAKGVQLADAAYRSHAERRWVDMEKLSI